MNYLLKCSIALFILFVAVLATTRLGVPFKWSEDSPRLRRTVILVKKLAPKPEKKVSKKIKFFIRKMIFSHKLPSLIPLYATVIITLS